MKKSSKTSNAKCVLQPYFTSKYTAPKNIGEPKR